MKSTQSIAVVLFVLSSAAEAATTSSSPSTTPLSSSAGSTVVSAPSTFARFAGSVLSDSFARTLATKGGMSLVGWSKCTDPTSGSVEDDCVVLALKNGTASIVTVSLKATACTTTGDECFAGYLATSKTTTTIDVQTDGSFAISSATRVLQSRQMIKPDRSIVTIYTLPTTPRVTMQGNLYPYNTTYRSSSGWSVKFTLDSGEVIEDQQMFSPSAGASSCADKAKQFESWSNGYWGTVAAIESGLVVAGTGAATLADLALAGGVGSSGIATLGAISAGVTFAVWNGIGAVATAAATAAVKAACEYKRSINDADFENALHDAICKEGVTGCEEDVANASGSCSSLEGLTATSEEYKNSDGETCWQTTTFSNCAGDYPDCVCHDNEVATVCTDG